MNPEARAEMVAHAERALRRGELSEALSLYETLCRAFPEDPALALKLANLRETLQPQELQALQALQASARPEAIPQGPSSPAAEGERLFSLGDYAGAAAAYRRALQERPDNELIRERLEELYRLARALPVHSPTDRKLPRQAEPLLHALLDRLAARRRLKRD
ncbi:tetratricopeptide repeat protein [Archangium sp.]|uniref:tetratricopeptide repeat protein n=1 Tax=Archangium sp. TaxID=1872627 RepID=UPI002D5BDF6A|nr:tetratricopeptide repeat protein [Archangium sp.]HYO54535.1 tetratricopeptide repeat protein [Archangium sp.]